MQATEYAINYTLQHCCFPHRSISISVSILFADVCLFWQSILEDLSEMINDSYTQSIRRNVRLTQDTKPAERPSVRYEQRADEWVDTHRLTRQEVTDKVPSSLNDSLCLCVGETYAPWQPSDSPGI